MWFNKRLLKKLTRTIFYSIQFRTIQLGQTTRTIQFFNFNLVLLKVRLKVKSKKCLCKKCLKMLKNARSKKCLKTLFTIYKSIT